MGGGSKQLTSLYINTNGSNKELISASGNINGTSKLIFSKLYKWAKYTYTKDNSEYSYDIINMSSGSDGISVSSNSAIYVGSGTYTQTNGSSVTLYLSSPKSVNLDDMCRITFNGKKYYESDGNISALSGYWVIKYSPTSTSITVKNDQQELACKISSISSPLRYSLVNPLYSTRKFSRITHLYKCTVEYVSSTDPNAYTDNSSQSLFSLGSDSYKQDALNLNSQYIYYKKMN